MKLMRCQNLQSNESTQQLARRRSLKIVITSKLLLRIFFCFIKTLVAVLVGMNKRIYMEHIRYDSKRPFY